MKKIEFAAARPYAAPSCKLVKMMPRQSILQDSGAKYAAPGRAGDYWFDGGSSGQGVNDYGDELL